MAGFSGLHQRVRAKALAPREALTYENFSTISRGVPDGDNGPRMML
jgi:hypothetical protein